MQLTIQVYEEQPKNFATFKKELIEFMEVNFNKDSDSADQIVFDEKTFVSKQFREMCMVIEFTEEQYIEKLYSICKRLLVVC